MPEIKKPVRSVQVDYTCDVEGCGGVMRYEAYVVTTFPPKYSHRCNKCGTTMVFTTIYPSIRHELTEEASHEAA